jgi:hypothetical protein
MTVPVVDVVLVDNEVPVVVWLPVVVSVPVDGPWVADAPVPAEDEVVLTVPPQPAQPTTATMAAAHRPGSTNRRVDADRVRLRIFMSTKARPPARFRPSKMARYGAAST